MQADRDRITKMHEEMKLQQSMKDTYLEEDNLKKRKREKDRNNENTIKATLEVENLFNDEEEEPQPVKEKKKKGRPRLKKEVDQIKNNSQG